MQSVFVQIKFVFFLVFGFCFNVFQGFFSLSLELTKVDEVGNAREGCCVTLGIAIYD